VPSRVCHLGAECMIARSSAYANFLEVGSKSCMLMLNKRNARTDPSGTPFSDVVTCFESHYRW